MENGSLETQESFVQKVFGCCFNRDQNELEIGGEETNRELVFLGSSKFVFENQLSIFPNNLIRPEEKNKIKFTKDDLIEYIKKQQELVYPLIVENGDMKITKRNFTELKEKLPLIRCEITKHKIYFTNVPTILDLANAIRNPELRRKWDNNLKEYKIMQKIKKESEIVKTITNKQLSVIPEKEFYDKRIGIYKDNIYYLFSSSIPDSIYPIENYDRAKNYMSIMVIREDDDNFYFDCLNQIDININLPIEFIEANIVNKVKSFFNKYFEFLNLLK